MGIAYLGRDLETGCCAAIQTLDLARKFVPADLRCCLARLDGEGAT